MAESRKTQDIREIERRGTRSANYLQRTDENGKIQGLDMDKDRLKQRIVEIAMVDVRAYINAPHSGQLAGSIQFIYGAIREEHWKRQESPGPPELRECSEFRAGPSSWQHQRAADSFFTSERPEGHSEQALFFQNDLFVLGGTVGISHSNDSISTSASCRTTWSEVRPHLRQNHSSSSGFQQSFGCFIGRTQHSKAHRFIP
jgi:hypothetical protein